jgi:hypothetical protein
MVAREAEGAGRADASDAGCEESGERFHQLEPKMSCITEDKFRNLTVVRGGRYATPRTHAERFRVAVRSRYAAIRTRRGTSPGGPFYDAARGKTHPLETVRKHLDLAKVERTAYGDAKAFVRGLWQDADEYVDRLYGRETGQHRPAA